MDNPYGENMSDTFEFDPFDDETNEEVMSHNFLSNLVDPVKYNELRTSDIGGSLKIMAFEVKTDKDYADGSTFTLCKIPSGQVRILGHLSPILYNLSCKSLDLGWIRYKTRSLNWIETNRVGFNTIKKFGTVKHFLDHIKLGSIVIDSMEGVPIIGTVNGKGKEGDKIAGYIVYVRL